MNVVDLIESISCNTHQFLAVLLKRTSAKRETIGTALYERIFSKDYFETIRKISMVTNRNLR